MHGQLDSVLLPPSFFEWGGIPTQVSSQVSSQVTSQVTSRKTSPQRRGEAERWGGCVRLRVRLRVSLRVSLRVLGDPPHSKKEGGSSITTLLSTYCSISSLF